MGSEGTPPARRRPPARPSGGVRGSRWGKARGTPPPHAAREPTRGALPRTRNAAGPWRATRRGRNPGGGARGGGRRRGVPRVTAGARVPGARPRARLGLGASRPDGAERESAARGVGRERRGRAAPSERTNERTARARAPPLTRTPPSRRPFLSRGPRAARGSLPEGKGKGGNRGGREGLAARPTPPLSPRGPLLSPPPLRASRKSVCT